MKNCFHRKQKGGTFYFIAQLVLIVWQIIKQVARIGNGIVFMGS